MPVYVFGSSRTFLLAPLSWLLAAVSRLLRVSLIGFVGAFGLPIPFRRTLLYAVGDAIQVPHLEKPSRADIELWHAVLVASMERLYHRYARLYHMGVHREWGVGVTGRDAAPQVPTLAAATLRDGVSGAGRWSGSRSPYDALVRMATGAAWIPTPLSRSLVSLAGDVAVPPLRIL